MKICLKILLITGMGLWACLHNTDAQITDSYEGFSFYPLFKKEYLLQNKVKTCTVYQYTGDQDPVKDSKYVFDKNGMLVHTLLYGKIKRPYEEIFFTYKAGVPVEKKYKEFNGEKVEQYAFTYQYDQGRLIKQCYEIEVKINGEKEITDHSILYYYDEAGRLVYSKDAYYGFGHLFIYRDDEVREYLMTPPKYSKKILLAIDSVENILALTNSLKDSLPDRVYRSGRLMEDRPECYEYYDDGRIKHMYYCKEGIPVEIVEYENFLPVKLTSDMKADRQKEIWMFSYTYY